MFGTLKLPKKATIGKTSKLLPAKAGLATLGKSARTIQDYSKQVPTLDTSDSHPLIMDLARKQQSF